MIHTAGCESHEDLMRLCNAERAHREKLYQDGLPSVVIDLDLHDNTFTIISSDGDHVSLGLPLDQAVEKFRAYLTNLAIEVRRRDHLCRRRTTLPRSRTPGARTGGNPPNHPS